ncbi:MAG: recombinase family protein [Carnobacterium sp.]|nr:recombinase family protein [Carnobacterium sp.]
MLEHKNISKKISVKNMVDRVELKEALQFLQEQDILIVESLDRLGQNYDDIIQIVQELNQK